jgi:hypothetical protein
VAIAAAYQTVVTVATSTGALWTAPSSTSATYGSPRDLVVTNSGTTTCWFAVGGAVSSAATTSSFQVPAGGTVILTQCQVPAGLIFYGVSPTNAGQASIGFATNVAYI